MNNEIPRNEHPNPQWERTNYKNLNGKWEFEFDFGKSSIDRERYKAEKLEKEILVPFCPESKLSGIEYKDFMNAVCYQKKISFTEEELKNRVILHFGAVDYKSILYVNEKRVGSHIGGYTSFEFDITEYVKEGENKIFLYAEDDCRNATQCRGKQTERFYSFQCDYTRTTGIWQTVWIEFVPKNYIKAAKFYPNIYNPSVLVKGTSVGYGEVKAVAKLKGEIVGEGKTLSNGNFEINIPLSKKLLWEVGKGGLYDIELVFGEDKVKSYFGLREVRIDGYKVCINDKSVFQRLVLDQGYYPDGIYTAPTKEDLLKDIELSMKVGFNGARLHEKVFEPLFLYYADKLGYLVWGEYPSWGITDYSSGVTLADFTNAWLEEMARDFNHPSIIGWCPFNETWDYYEFKREDRVLETTYNITKAFDSTRPCIDTSGMFHVVTDIYDIHEYEQKPEVMRERYQYFADNGDFDLTDFKGMQSPFYKDSYKYKKGMPFFISEYGGIKWDVAEAENLGNDQKASWGYGNGPKTPEEFIERYKGLTEALLFNKNMFGFCYTQLYDVEQEKNGIFTYERKEKFDSKIFYDINSQKAAIED